MQPFVYSQTMRQCDQNAITAGTPSRELMERAARRAIEQLKNDSRFFLAKEIPIFVFCGGGNNGGDGFAAARFLCEEGYTVTVIYTGKYANTLPDEMAMSAECARQYRLYQPLGKVYSFLPAFSSPAVIIDAMVGIGLHTSPDEAMAAHIRAIRAAGCPVLALDVPSGVNADTGEVPGEAVHATATVTMACLKPGLLLYPARAFVGTLTVADIGIPVPQPDGFVLETKDLSLPRIPYGNKGTFGRVAVCGGSRGMSGAAYFAGLCAYQTGAGLVEICADESGRTVLQLLLPEAIFTPHEQADETFARADALVIGCGLGQSEHAASLFARAVQTPIPLVIDADALNLLATEIIPACSLASRSEGTVLTPHPGEAARLLKKTVADVKADLPASARAIAQKYHAVCVLKDAGAVITDGKTVWLSTAGNDGMATGGSGDCLAGIIASVLAQTRNSDRDALEKAAQGVLIHGLAGDAAAQKVGHAALLARDIAEGISRVLP